MMVLFRNISGKSTILRSTLSMGASFLLKTISLMIIGMMLAGICTGQKILVLENVISLKNIKYYEGDDIILLLKGMESRTEDVIVDMTDSCVVLAMYGNVDFSDIRVIYRELWFVKTLSALSMIGGAAYFSIDSFNRLINEEWPVVDEQTLIISAGMVGFGFLLMPLKYRRIQVGDRWKFKVLDLNAF